MIETFEVFETKPQWVMISAKKILEDLLMLCKVVNSDKTLLVAI